MKKSRKQLLHRMMEGNRLAEVRARHNFSQEALAEAIGTTARSINRWEHTYSFPQPYYLDRLCQVLQCTPEELFGASEKLNDETDGSAPLWYVPYARNPYFTGREAILHRIHEQLQVEGRVALTQPQIVSGLGGIGKTQTALEYAYRFRHEYQSVLWISAETRETLLSGFLALARLFQLPEKDHIDQTVVLEAVTRWFQSHTGWLLIFDNVEDLELPHAMLPDHSQGQILITTRSQIIGTLGAHLDLQKMDLIEGTLFLLRRAKLLHLEAPLETVALALRTRAEILVALLDGLPLGLDQAGAYIEETGCTLEEYQERYAIYRQALLNQRGAISTHHPASVTTTFSLAFQQVKKASPAAADVLRMCAFLHADAIPERFLTLAGETLGPILQALAADPLGPNAAIRELRRFSLLQREPIGKTLSIHRLLQVIIQDEMEETERQLWRGRILRMLRRVFPPNGPDLYIQMESWSWCEQIVPHIAWITALPEQREHTSEVVALISRLAFYFQDRARYDEAEKNHQLVLAIWEHESGSHDLALIESLVGLVDATWSLGKQMQAMSYAQQAITLIENTLDADPFNLIPPLNVLSNALREQGELQAAEQLLLRAFSIWVFTVQAEEAGKQPSIEAWKQKSTEQAPDKLLQQALTLWPQNPHRREFAIGRITAALAHVYQKQKRYVEAEALLIHALSFGEKALGINHHILATPMITLAKVYKGQGRLSEAQQYYQRALTLLEENLGENHSLTCNARNIDLKLY